MADRTGQELGNYRLVSLLGRGGFAEVYLGEHLRLKTKAAIKVLYTQLQGDDTESFLTEAQTIAHLVHPHIVRIFDFDVKEGVPFLVMDYAPNGNLRQRHPRNTRVPLETIVSYIKQVADALQYAHDEKFIHRDIKPENMLLGRRSEILLSDFGIALIAQSTRMQSTQEVMGTAYYMVPEQLQGKPRLASDQYALGIVVYEWLSGNRPFHGSFSEIASQHMFVPPAPLREQVPSISPAIEEVVMTALAKDPKQRFGTVRAFANALEQASESTRSSFMVPPPGQTPVQSEPLIQPGRPPVQSSSQPIKLQSGPITSPSQSKSQSITPPPPDRSVPPVTANPPGQIPVRSSPPYEPTTLYPFERGISRRAVLIGLAGVAVAGGGVIWLVQSQKSQKPLVGTTLYTYRGHSASVNAMVWSPDGRRIASASDDKTVQVWDAANGGNAFTYHGHSGIVHAIAWSPNKQLIASGSDDKTVKVWNAPDGGKVFTYSEHFLGVNAVTWSPDGKRIASGSYDNTVQVWNAADGANAFIYRGHSGTVSAVAWSPDGNRIASGSYDGTVQVWDASYGYNGYTYRGHSNSVHAVSWSPDGKRIASAGDDGTAQVWDATDGSHVYTYQGHSSTVHAVAWSPNGQRIASASTDQTVHVWQASG